MPRLTRRSLFAKTGAGAAAAGVLTVAPGLLASGRHSSAGPASASASVGATTAGSSNALAKKPAPPSQLPTVAYVRDAAKGEVVLMVGTTEIVRHDPALVEYLGRCCDTGQA